MKYVGPRLVLFGVKSLSFAFVAFAAAGCVATAPSNTAGGPRTSASPSAELSAVDKALVKEYIDAAFAEGFVRGCPAFLMISPARRADHSLFLAASYRELGHPWVEKKILEFSEIARSKPNCATATIAVLKSPEKFSYLEITSYAKEIIRSSVENRTPAPSSPLRSPKNRDEGTRV